VTEPRQGPAYRIETERLVLRCYHPTDAPLLAAAITTSVDSLRPWMPWARNEPKPVSEKVKLLRQFRGAFDLGHDFAYGVFNPTETEILGGTGLHPRIGPDAREIGYWIHVAHTGRGLATEMAAALTRVGFEVDKLHHIEIRCGTDNARSAAVARKLGYVHEATLRERFPLDEGVWRDTMIWSLMASEYPDSPAARVELRAFDAAGERLL
jgi:RimJ/RimL family protein N-acetyltransferase